MMNIEVIKRHPNDRLLRYISNAGAHWHVYEPGTYHSEDEINSWVVMEFATGRIWDRNIGWRKSAMNFIEEGLIGSAQVEPNSITWHKDIWRDAYRHELPTWFIGIVINNTFSIDDKDYLELESGGAVELVPGMVIKRRGLKK